MKALAIAAVLGIFSGVVAAAEPAKTPDQIIEDANLELLAGRALYNSGSLRLEVVRLQKQIAAEQDYWRRYIAGMRPAAANVSPSGAPALTVLKGGVGK